MANHRLHVSTAVFAVALMCAYAARAQTSQLVAEWVEGSNPNGRWSYRQGNALLGHLPVWSTFPVPQPAYANVSGGAGHIPAALRVLSVPAGFDLQVGDVMMHTWDSTNGGQNGEARIVWTAPAPGTVAVAGVCWMPRDISRAVDWALDHNGVTMTACLGHLFSGDQYGRANPFSFAAGSGGAAALHQVAVAAGDTITLRIFNAPGQLFGDFLAVDWSVAYLGTAALALPIGSGCGGAFVPVLTVSAPVIGAPVVFSITGGTPITPGTLFFSAIPAGPLPIGGACTVYLDLGSIAELVPLQTNGAGAWSIAFSMPFVPALAGVSLALQAAVYPTASPLGLDLTNGVYAVIGY